MTFEELDRRTGKKVVVGSKYWPDGTRFRRRFPSVTTANKVLNRIQMAIAMGTWRELKRELTEGPPKDFSLQEFADIYLEEYCRVRNTRPDFKEETLSNVVRILGQVKLRDFRRSHAQHFEAVRSREVRGATVNRGLAVLSNMLTFALRKGLIDVHPMSRYGRIPEDQKVLHILEPAEERLLVLRTLEVDPIVGAYVGILGETGLRMEEGLNLQWDHVRISQKQLTVAASKNYKVRHVPLSEYAIQLLGALPRVLAVPYVFVRLSTMERLRAPRKELYAGRKAAGLGWVGFHDLRHYRATQWVKHGLDLRTVQEWLGHRDIQTTMRYSHYCQAHALRGFDDAEQLEIRELAAAEKGASRVGDK